MDHPPSYVAEQATEQPTIIEKTTMISRTRFIDENRDDYFETVNTESKLGIIDILDSETEFLISGAWGRGGHEDYIYLFTLGSRI